MLALVVSLALIVGVNYANDYSDGIRGTDDVRAGPLRLVGSKLATPRAVLTAAVVSLAIGASGRPGAGARDRTVADRDRRRLHRRGVALHRRFEAVRLLGPRRGRGVRVLRPGRGARHPVHPGDAIDWVGGALAVATGPCRRRCWWPTTFATFRPTRKSGKITLAVRLGDARTRLLYQVLVALAFVLTLVLMLATPWSAVGLVAAPLAVRAAKPVRGGLGGKDLIPFCATPG